MRNANLKLRSMAEKKSTEAGKGKQGQIEATFSSEFAILSIIAATIHAI